MRSGKLAAWGAAALVCASALAPAAQAQDFFTDAPPNCDPAQSDRLGLFVNQRLSGVAELSYGFPEPDGDRS